MTDARSFGAWLRRERERRAVTLRAIADRTKVGAGLLEGLERGDISRWPGGIYRRAFVRAYAEAVGLDAELVLANFEQVYAPDPSIAPAATTPIYAEPNEMRLALATPAAPGPSAAALKTACRHLACVLGVALLAYPFAGALGFWCAAAIAALAFHLFRVLELSTAAPWHRWFPKHTSSPDAPRAEVVNFSEEHERSTSRRTRAGRLIADLSAAAGSAAIPGRRRTARS